MARTARLTVEIDGRGARSSASGINSELDRLKGNARGVSREFDLLSRAMAAAFAYFGGRELLRFADTATQVRSRLAALSSTTQELARHQQTVFDISQRTRSELDATSTLYATLTRSGEDLGLQQAQIARITETVNKSFAITGTDGNTASQAIRQLGQAFQSGVLRGDEFNTMAEAAPVLMEALARSLGKPRSELRALAEDGKLTTDQLVKAFSDPRITAGIDEQFAKITPTVQQRLTQLSNAAIVAIGKFDEATGITQGLGAAIGFLTDNMSTLIPIVASLAVAYGSKLVLGAIQARLAIITMSAAAAGAQAPLAALGFTARAAGASLLSAFGGPIGAAVTGLAVVIGGLASEVSQADARFQDANNSLAESEAALSAIETRAREAGIQTGFLSTSSQAAGNQFSALGPLIAATAQLYGDLGKNAQFAAEQMIRAKIAEAQTNIATLETKLNSTNQRPYNANEGSANYAIGSAVRGIVGAIRRGTGIEESDRNSLAAERQALANRRRELAILQSIGIDKSDAPGVSPVADPKKRTGSNSGANKAAEEAKRLAEFAKQAQAEITSMREQYDGTADDIAQANAAQRSLNDLIAEITEKKPPNFDKLIEQAKAIGPLIEANLKKPINDILLQQERDIAIQRLVTEGRTAEADQLQLQFQIMQQLGVETEEQLATALFKRGVTEDEYNQLFANLGVMRQLTEEEKLRNQIVQDRLDQVDGIRRNVEQTLAEAPANLGKAISNFFDDFWNQFKSYFARTITESLFGDAFRELEAEISGKAQVVEADKRVVQANGIMAKSIVTTAVKLEELGNAAANAQNNIPGAPPANDNTTEASDAAAAFDEIVVNGTKSLGGKLDVFGRTFTKLFETFLGKDSPLAASIGKFLGQALKDAAIGQVASQAFGKVFGVKQSNTGAGIGGAIGGAIGSAVGGPLGAAIGKTLGGIVGGTIGGLFKKAKVGTATLNFNSSTGELGADLGGNNAGARNQASGSADSVISGLQRIAESLGGTLTGLGSVSIGVRDGKFRVDPTGRGNTKTKKGAIDFGDDEDAAIRYAIRDMIRDGAIAGLRAGTQALIQGGKDLEVQLEKALKFEGVFRELREIDDPVGAAVEAINKEFEGLIKIFKEAGASTADYVQLERLYQIKREKAITEANDRLVGTLKDYLFDLTAGTNSVLSPQTRYQNSLAELNRLDALRASGGNVDASQYRSVADAFLAASRDYQGSTVGYFEDFRRITTTIESWIASEQARASTTLPSIDFTPLTAAVNNQTTVTTALLQQISNNIAAMINNGGLAAANENYYPSAPNAGGYSRYLSNY